MRIVRKCSSENSENRKKLEETSNYKKTLETLEEKEKRNFYIKAQNAIKNAKIQKYMNDREIVAKEPISFWGVITGKNSLQLQRIENIKLKIELLETQKIKEKAEYDPKDILADLYSCAISELNGKFTNEMKNIYDEVNEKYCDNSVSEENIYKLISEKVDNSQTYLPVIHKETKGIFGDIKVQIDFFKLENKKLQDQIIFERGKSQLETFKPKIIPVTKVVAN